MKQNKILYVHHAGELGGAPRSLSFLLDNLDTSQYAAKLLCIERGQVQELFKSRPVELILDETIYPFHGSTVSGMSVRTFFRNFYRLPQSLINAIQFIRKHRPALVHLNSSCLFAVAVAAKIVDKQIKVVCHVREPLLKNSISGSIMRYMNYFFVDHFIAIDSFTGGSMKTSGNIDIVYNSVNFREYNPEIKSNILRQELKLGDDSVIFLFLARIAPSNGALDLIKIANNLTKKYKNYHFVIVGLHSDLPTKYIEQTLKDSEGNENIHIMNFRNDVPMVISSCDIMVVPFTLPHFARSIVEASAIGKPTIGSNIGGVNELVLHEQTGLLYNDLAEFESYCVKLGNSIGLRRTLARGAIAFARENFNNDLNTKKVYKVYEDLLNLSRSDN